MPSPRQWATLIWLGVFLVYAFFHASVRESVVGVVRAFFTPKVAVPLATMLIYLAGCLWLASKVGVWTTDLVTDTVFWFVGPAIAMVLRFEKVYEGHYVRTLLKQALAWAVFIEFLVGIFTFSLAVELILLPLLLTLGLTSAFAELKPEHAQVKKFIDGLLGLLGLWIAGYVLYRLITDWGSINKVGQIQALALPIWLTIVSLPFVVAVAAYAAYDTAFIRTDIAGNGHDKGRRAKLALLSVPSMKLKYANSFAGSWAREAIQAGSLREARTVVKEFVAARQAAEQAEQDAAQRLVDMAGVAGTDEEGRCLDQREFKETRDALLGLHTSESGWYNQRGRYRDDLLEMLAPTFQRKGLPEQHGISLHVAEDGQSWRAWRRTITGWCFAIGAARPPPDQWLYDGPEPPTGFPGDDPSWGEPIGIDAVNW